MLYPCKVGSSKGKAVLPPMPTSQSDYASFLAGTTSYHNGKLTSVDYAITKVHISITANASGNCRLTVGKSDGTTQQQVVNMPSSAGTWNSVNITLDMNDAVAIGLAIETASIASATEVRFYFD